MYNFQDTVHIGSAHSVAGEVGSNTPTTGISLTVTSPTELNFYGRAYAYQQGTPIDTECEIAAYGHFIGIACMSKSMVGGAVWDGANFLAKQGSTIHLLTSGTINVLSSEPCYVGDNVFCNVGTGEIQCTSTGTPANHMVIRGAQVVYKNSVPTALGGKHSCVIKLMGGVA